MVQDALIPLGFTELESAAYQFLLRDSPATGYRVAQGIRRPVANTYKAIESLRAKGAVVVENSEGKLVRAVPAKELLRRIESDFVRRRKHAAQTLSTISARPDDDAVYRLDSIEQVYERCRAMLRRATSVVALDLFPAPFRALRADIERCVARGVMVAMQVYEPVVLRGAEVVVNARAAQVLSRWSGQWINIARDSAEHLVALLDADAETIEHATWTASAFLAHIAYSGLIGEITAAALMNASPRDFRRVARRMARYADIKTTGVRTLSQPRPKSGRPSIRARTATRR